MRNDHLDLQVPIWVTGIGFVPDGDAHPTIAVATGHNQVQSLGCSIEAYLVGPFAR